MLPKPVAALLTVICFGSCFSPGAQAIDWGGLGGSISGGWKHAGGVISKGSHHAGSVVSDASHHAGGVVSSGAHHSGKVASDASHHAGGIASGATHHAVDVVKQHAPSASHVGQELGKVATGKPIVAPAPFRNHPLLNPTTMTNPVQGAKQLSGASQHAITVGSQGYTHASQMVNHWNIDPNVHNSTTNKWMVNADRGTLPFRQGVGIVAADIGKAFVAGAASGKGGGYSGQSQGPNGPTVTPDGGNNTTAPVDWGDGGSGSGSGSGSADSEDDKADEPRQVTGAFLTNSQQPARSHNLSHVVNRSAASLHRTGQADPRRPLSK